MGEPKWITFDTVSGVPELTATELRQIEAAYFEGPAGGQVYSGVRYGTGLVSLAGTTITYQALNFVIQGVTTSTGAYVGFEPQSTLTLSPAHATLARTDRVWVEVQDHEADASNQRRSRVVYATGTPGGAAATLPTAAVLLAEINVPINNTAGAVVTDKRTYYNAPPDMQVFTANGTWTKPPNLKAVRLRLTGGGGGGGAGISTNAGQGAAGGGGGGAQTCEAIIPAASLSASVTVTIGAAGTANGGNGGATTFGTLITANGGLAGGNQSGAFQSGSTDGGAGGTGAGGTWSPVMRWDGEAGGVGRVGSGEPQPAEGGASGLQAGAGGRQGANVSGQIPGRPGRLYGGGGAGGANRESVTPGGGGGTGAAGVVIVEHIYR